MAKLYIEKMDLPKQGLEIYQNLVATAPESQEAAEANYKSGICHFKAEKYEEAEKSFNIVINKFSNLEWANKAQLMLAKSYEKAQNFKRLPKFMIISLIVILKTSVLQQHLLIKLRLKETT